MSYQEKFQEEFNNIHRNIPQLLVFLIDAVITVILFGRGTGKTHGVTATWIYLRAKILVRSQGFILSQSYAHLIDTIIPQMQAGWTEIGLRENVHYWVRKKPPKELRIPEPYLVVDKPEYFIFWINGSVTKLVSLDRKAMVNSKSFDYGAICEGRKLDGVQIQDDVIPTIRGGRQNLLPDGKRFGECYQHHSLLVESDLPHDVRGRWVLRYKKQVDHQTVNDILKLHRFIYDKTLEFSKAKTKRLKDEIQALIDEVKESINEMRRDLVFVAKASTLDNIHALGINTLKTLRRNLDPVEWDTSILNIEQEEIQNNFYRSLEKKTHGYGNAIDYDFVDTQIGKVKHNWRWDKDLDYTQGLMIALDCNNAHNCLGTFQVQKNVAKMLKYFYNVSQIGNPQTHKDLMQTVCEYYEGYPKKEFILIINNTMIGGELNGLASYATDVEGVARKNGFAIKRIYLGQANEHGDTMNYWDKLLTNQLPIKFAFNILNCEQWYEVCKNTPTKLRDSAKKGTVVKKDKSSETNPRIPPQNATHGGEMTDQFLQWLVNTYEQPANTKGFGAMAAG